jgi:hypothetical protein
MNPVTAFAHRPAYCTSCGARYASLEALLDHQCKAFPSLAARDAFMCLMAFRPKNEIQVRMLLSMWARRVELNEEDVRYVVTEVMK